MCAGWELFAEIVGFRDREWRQWRAFPEVWFGIESCVDEILGFCECEVMEEVIGAKCEGVALPVMVGDFVDVDDRLESRVLARLIDDCDRQHNQE